MTSLKIDFSAYDRTRYFPSLDGLRALLVVLVMFNHVHAKVPAHVLGYLGPDGFFVLSGYLITTLLLRECATSGRVSLRAFYLRRFFRIVPVFLLTIALYVIAVMLSHDSSKQAQFKASLPWLLSFLPEFRPHAAGNILGHAWTLGIEEKFYLVWPVLLLAIVPIRKKTLPILLLPMFALLLLPHEFARSYGGLSIGTLLAVLLSRPARERVRKMAETPDSLICVAIACAYWIAQWPRGVYLFDLAIAWLLGILVLRPGDLRAILESRFLVYVGRRSYAFYLIHVLVLNAVSAALGRYFAVPTWFEVVPLGFLFTLAGAALIHLAVEKPCIALGRRLAARFEVARASDVTLRDGLV